MKLLSLFLLTVLLTVPSWGHGGGAPGPNGGRLLEFGKDPGVQGELTLTNGVFRVVLLDRDQKPVVLGTRILTVSGGDRNQPEKPTVTRDGDAFTFPALKGDEYPLVLQLREASDAPPLTARLTFDASICSGCKHPEWLCQCE